MSKKEKRDTAWLGAIVPEYTTYRDKRVPICEPLSRKKAREVAKGAGHFAEATAAHRLIAGLYRKGDEELNFEIERALALEPCLWTETAVAVKEMVGEQASRYHALSDPEKTSIAMYIILIDNLIGAATRLAVDILPGTTARQVVMDAATTGLTMNGQRGLVDLLQAMVDGD